MPSKYQYLLTDDDVRRWFENLNTRSVITATVSLRTLGLFCEMRHTSPREMLATANTKQFKDEFTDFVRSLEKKGKAGSYIIRFKKVLQSWLAYNDLEIKFNVNIAGEYDSPTLTNERVPSKEELDKILRMATPRARVSIALMAFSGLRPESLEKSSRMFRMTRLASFSLHVNPTGFAFRLHVSIVRYEERYQ